MNVISSRLREASLGRRKGMSGRPGWHKWRLRSLVRRAKSMYCMNSVHGGQLQQATLALLLVKLTNSTSGSSPEITVYQKKL